MYNLVSISTIIGEVEVEIYIYIYILYFIKMVTNHTVAANNTITVIPPVPLLTRE